ncbi:MAG: xylose isomerase [Phycisphaerae bacterium]|nr:xylose isomerase [Phycisphaerae bacterium]
MPSPLDRRTFLGASLGTGLTTSLTASTITPASTAAPPPTVAAAAGTFSPDDAKFKYRKACKFGMTRGQSLSERFQSAKDAGFDGVEMDSPNGMSTLEVVAAAQEVGIRIPGVVDSVHWQITLSDPDAAKREEGRKALETAIRDSHAYGGTSVLLVPAVCGNSVSEEAAWERSIGEIRKTLPLAADLGIHVLIENVWNRFLYNHDGSNNQSAEKFAAYLDAIDSPWVGAYFDIGNHQKYGAPAEWIRTLGSRLVKCDVKDWGVKSGWARIGDGDVDWAAVNQALSDIGFTGWVSAEVGGGDTAYLQTVAERVDRVFSL